MNDKLLNSMTLRSKEVAQLLGIGERSLFRHVKSGAFPRPMRLGRSLRWSRIAVLDWIDCRSREGGAR
jgi:predicted DNA-binding transcriptional regulator AlpA